MNLYNFIYNLLNELTLIRAISKYSKFTNSYLKCVTVIFNKYVRISCALSIFRPIASNNWRTYVMGLEGQGIVWLKRNIRCFLKRQVLFF